MLVDLNTLVRPRLYVMDAVMAMEGNGPRSGRPRSLGLILASDDPVALDSVASRIIDLDPEYVPTSRPGEESGLGTYHAENIEIIGANLNDVVRRDFDVIRQPPEHSTGGRMLRFVKNRITARPAIDRETCTWCGTCVTMCPVEPKAVDWHSADHSEPPRHHYGRCIRCYCCQENCPEGAIHVENPLLGRVFFRA
jgi:ferredoxin